jgi:hypothetical protein
MNKKLSVEEQRRVRDIIEHYESQTEEEAAAEDEAAFSREGYAWVQVPHELLPEVDRLIAKHEKKQTKSVSK